MRMILVTSPDCTSASNLACHWRRNFEEAMNTILAPCEGINNPSHHGLEATCKPKTRANFYCAAICPVSGNALAQATFFHPGLQPPITRERRCRDRQTGNGLSWQKAKKKEEKKRNPCTRITSRSGLLTGYPERRR